jgi:NarL family two-component system response regulator LiaR
MEKKLIGGRFESGTLIGAGATGSVYDGLDTHTAEKVAIKALRPELIAETPELLERFRREGEALRKLNHPNIVKVLATIDEEENHYIIMEYVSGGSLADLIQRQSLLPIDRIVSIALELSDALTRAHHLDILHRDIKPGNVLLAEDGTPRLTDFGLARMGSYPALTTVGSILGTFNYLSPEVCYNQKLDPRSDIWSFGVVLYEMLTGQLPFTGDSPFEIIHAILNQPLPDPTWYRKDIPVALTNLLEKMLMKDILARIASTRQVGAELEIIQKGLKLPSRQNVEPIKSSPRFPSSPATINSSASSPQITAKIRVLIVDDHAVVRQGLKTFLELQDDIEVVGEGSDGAQAVDLAEKLQPDVILLDLVMPQMDGIEATRRILTYSHNSHILILTSFGEDDKVFPAIRAGAQGYLLKDIDPNELVQAVRDASQGKALLHPDIAQKLMSAVVASPTPKVTLGPVNVLGNLTEREEEVLRLIARGLNNREIADKMVISEKTVKTHVSNILGKLGLEDRTQAAIWALKHNLGSED